MITATILYAVGTGSIKGFAITTAIGIATSMFTAIVGTRAIVNLLYGGKRIKSRLFKERGCGARLHSRTVKSWP